MTDVKVEQCDIDRARKHEPNGVDYFAANGMVEKHWLVMLVAETRQAAEKAQQDRDAGIAEGKYAAIGWNGHYRSAGHSIATAIRSQGHE